MLSLAISFVLAYLIGTIPTAYLFAKIIKGIDIRNYGSGNIGATNVYRIVGKGHGFIVLAIDLLKGFAPVMIFPVLFYNSVTIDVDLYKILIGGAAISGHVFNVFMKFSGGKGVATTSGVLLALDYRLFFISLLVWLIFLIIFRYVSLASIIAGLSLPITSLILGKKISIVVFSIILCFIGSYKHKSNIKRLVKGEEKKIF